MPLGRRWAVGGPALWLYGFMLAATIGTVLASNTAVRFIRNLNQTGKIFTVSLPLNTSYHTADDLFQDINAKCGGGTATKIERINPSAGATSRTTWGGSGNATDNFSIVPGQGYLVQVNNACTWRIVGSHDDEFVYTFANTTYDYLTSIPANSTALTADDIFTSITNCTKVERINVSTGGTSRTTWAGAGSAEQNFTVVRGEAYIIKVGTANTSWTPSHY